MIDLSAQTILDAIAAAATRWRSADFPLRLQVTRALVRRTGYTEPVVNYALDAAFTALDRAALEATIVSELGSLRTLDGFVARPGRPAAFFVPREPVAILSSDTTLGVALPALVFALAAKARVRIKDRNDQLVAAFVETLAEELPELGPHIEVGVWESSDAEATRALLADAATVVAYGRDTTLTAIRAHLRADALFFGFGHRTSIAYITRGKLTDVDAAAYSAHGLARDVLLYDGEGCLSPHAAFIERGAAIEPYRFAALLADACSDVSVAFPASASPDPEVVAYRNAARFRAAQGSGAAFGGASVPYLIVLDPPPSDPPPLLRRTGALDAVDGPADVEAFIERHGLPLEALGVAEGRPDLDALAIRLRVARIAPLGTMQQPPLGGEHGGLGRILPFVRAMYRG